MPLLSKKEQASIYEAFLAVQPQKGKWIKLVRIPGPKAKPEFSTYVSYNQDAQFLAYWAGLTLITTDDPKIPRVQFGSPILAEIQEKARSKGYRTIIVDAPTGLVLH